MAGGRQGARSGDGSQINQAGRDYNFHAVTNVRSTGWVALAVVIVAVVGALIGYAVIVDRSDKPAGQVSSLSSGGASAEGPTAQGGAAGVAGRTDGPSAPDTDALETPPPSRSPQRPATEPAVQWQGTLVVGTQGKDLDSTHPGGSSSAYGADVTLGLSGNGLDAWAANGGSIAQWTGQGSTPGQGECAESADAAGLASAPLRQGAVLCVRTDQNRIARLKIVKVNDADFAFTVEFDAVVWQPAADQGG
ncbi:hypothetical protein ACF061_19225 [Streptomyces sp. NPDC015220]|uniref:hypothetical protein n=1 Tax=Streptomyces sp. NPDC015220 TaxID=3364947 RepID=UPI0036F5A3E8